MRRAAAGVDGADVAALITWFAVHPTSLNNTNSLVSGDNKGVASLVAERALNPGARPGAGPKIAAFASANLGDASPNIAGNFCRNTGDPCDVTTSTCPGAVATHRTGCEPGDRSSSLR